MSDEGQGTRIITLPPQDQPQKEDSLSAEQLRYLVRLVDQSDVAELEIKHGEKKSRLLLRKAGADTAASSPTPSPAIEEAEGSAPEQEYVIVQAQLVGIFQCWSKSKEKPLVAVGDGIKEGQHLGIIRSLDIPNEIEAPVTGRIEEILVQDGQLVEYGQPLMKVAKK